MSLKVWYSFLFFLSAWVVFRMNMGRG